MRSYSAAVAVLTGIALAVIAVGCGGDQKTSDPAPDVPSEPARLAFQNLVDDVAFVGDEACFSCHEDEYNGFKQHGMANAIYSLGPENEIEDFDGTVVHDSTFGFYYTVFKEGDKYFQEEYRLDEEGNKTHSQTREMQLGIGSGISARSYLIQHEGWLYELPITWYTQIGTWDFSPGYRDGNKRFDRKLTTRCLVCHDAYPDEVPFTDGKFEHIPLGISCERCHGPGELHVEERLTSPEPEDVDLTIVNPAYLSHERQMDVCQQCHLNSTVSLLREGETPYDFRPSEDLSEHIALFQLTAPSSNEAIGLTSHVGRMKESACYLGSLGTDAPMDCVTCHDPHSSFRESGPEYFNATCQSCHAPDALESRLASSPNLQDHTPESNCISCHMPKADIKRVAHSAFTDHWVRVVGRDDEPAPMAAHEMNQFKAVFERDRTEDPNVYEGMAYIVRGRQMQQFEFIERGIEILAPMLDAEDAYDEAQMILGIGYMQLGRAEDAEPWIEKAVEANPDIPERLNALAQLYETLQRDPTRIENLYRRALNIQPDRADIRVNYGRFLETRSRIEEAKTQYQLAIDEQEWLATAHFNLGTAYMRSGDPQLAESTLRRAIDLNPLNAESWSNLGILFASQGQPEAARSAFEAGVEADSTSAVALANLGTHHLAADENAQAIHFLERAVSQQPDYLEAVVNLALACFRDEQYDRAGELARHALTLNPGNELATQILGAI